MVQGYFLGGLLISLEAGQKRHYLSAHNVVCAGADPEIVEGGGGGGGGTHRVGGIFKFRPYESASEAVGDHHNHAKFMATGL